jgi:galactokinase
MASRVDPIDLAARFREAFGATPRVFQAPGRLNIIGEHVDHCGGRVLPAAIDRRVFVAVAANGADHVEAITPFGRARLPLQGFTRHGDWRDHVAGMAQALIRAGFPVKGADLLIESDVPVGAGVSSSAALAVGVGLALCAAAGLDPPDGPRLALVAQAAENDFVGMPCGVMDQFASANGRADSALALDCATLAFEAVPVPPRARFILIDSGVKHVHAEGGYAGRRADCEEAARRMAVARLADLPADAPLTSRLTGGPLKRARHVLGEIARVDRAITALLAGDLVTLGALMNASHESLSRDMEVSTPEVDHLAGVAQATPGVFGARMMGGGFGGAVIALADAEHAEAAMAAIVAAHGAWLGRPTTAFVATASSGAGEIHPVG